MPEAADYLAPPLAPTQPAADDAPAGVSETHELAGGFWRPKTPDAPEPPDATLGPDVPPEDASTLRFALAIWDCHARTQALLLADDTPTAAYEALKGERRAYRRCLLMLGFGPHERPTLAGRRAPMMPPMSRAAATGFHAEEPHL